MTSAPKGGYQPLMILFFIMIMAVCDYFLFREYELVWPFFWMPYIVMLIIYVSGLRKRGRVSALSHAVHLFIIMPVFAGLIMSLAWMAKINFWGEQLGGLFGH